MFVLSNFMVIENYATSTNSEVGLRLRCFQGGISVLKKLSETYKTGENIYPDWHMSVREELMDKWNHNFLKKDLNNMQTAWWRT